MSEEHDDSFDVILATMELPTAAKLAKIDKVEAAQSNQAVNTKQRIAPVGANAGAATAPLPKTAATAPLPKTAATNPHCILVHPKQRANPILKAIHNCPLEFRDIIPDYVVGRTSCVLYLSLRYHNLNPDYICQRIKELGKQYELRVLLVQVDTAEPHNALKSLTRISLLADLTLMLAWNAEEAGKIIESYKLLEKKSPDLIMERVESNPHQKLVSALTNIKPINKTDAMTLLQNFGTLENLINAREERLSQIIGLGPRKAHKLYKTLHEPFLNK